MLSKVPFMSTNSRIPQWLVKDTHKALLSISNQSPPPSVTPANKVE